MFKTLSNLIRLSTRGLGSSINFSFSSSNKRKIRGRDEPTRVFLQRYATKMHCKFKKKIYRPLFQKKYKNIPRKMDVLSLPGVSALLQSRVPLVAEVQAGLREKVLSMERRCEALDEVVFILAKELRERTRLGASKEDLEETLQVAARDACAERALNRTKRTTEEHMQSIKKRAERDMKTESVYSILPKAKKPQQQQQQPAAAPSKRQQFFAAFLQKSNEEDRTPLRYLPDSSILFSEEDLSEETLAKLFEACTALQTTRDELRTVEQSGIMLPLHAQLLKLRKRKPARTSHWSAFLAQLPNTTTLPPNNSLEVLLKQYLKGVVNTITEILSLVEQCKGLGTGDEDAPRYEVEDWSLLFPVWCLTDQLLTARASDSQVSILRHELQWAAALHKEEEFILQWISSSAEQSKAEADSYATTFFGEDGIGVTEDEGATIECEKGALPECNSEHASRGYAAEAVSETDTTIMAPLLRAVGFEGAGADGVEWSGGDALGEEDYARLAVIRVLVAVFHNDAVSLPVVVKA